MTDRRITEEDPERAVTTWFDRFGSCCAAGEYTEARELVADDVLSFGTKADIVQGLDHLQSNQWEQIWPRTADFDIDLDGARAFGTDELAWGMATWTSTGYDESGDPYHRPGRVTVVLERRDGAWLAVHTHFSLNPGTTQETFGPEGRIED